MAMILWISKTFFLDPYGFFFEISPKNLEWGTYSDSFRSTLGNLYLAISSANPLEVVTEVFCKSFWEFLKFVFFCNCFSSCFSNFLCNYSNHFIFQNLPAVPFKVPAVTSLGFFMANLFGFFCNFFGIPLTVFFWHIFCKYSRSFCIIAFENTSEICLRQLSIISWVVSWRQNLLDSFANFFFNSHEFFKKNLREFDSDTFGNFCVSFFEHVIGNYFPACFETFFQEFHRQFILQMSLRFSGSFFDPSFRTLLKILPDIVLKILSPISLRIHSKNRSVFSLRSPSPISLEISLIYFFLFLA